MMFTFSHKFCWSMHAWVNQGVGCSRLSLPQWLPSNWIPPGISPCLLDRTWVRDPPPKTAVFCPVNFQSQEGSDISEIELICLVQCSELFFLSVVPALPPPTSFLYALSNTISTPFFNQEKTDWNPLKRKFPPNKVIFCPVRLSSSCPGVSGLSVRIPVAGQCRIITASGRRFVAFVRFVRWAHEVQFASSLAASGPEAVEELLDCSGFPVMGAGWMSLPLVFYPFFLDFHQSCLKNWNWTFDPHRSP